MTNFLIFINSRIVLRLTAASRLFKFFRDIGNQTLARSSLLIFFLIPLILLLTLTGCGKKTERLENIIPPVAEKIAKELTAHGQTRIDNYYWLNERDNPKVLTYLEAENAYLEAVLKPREKLQKQLYKEIIGRIKQDDASVPYTENGYYYYHRYEKGEEYPVHARKKGSLDADEEILLDVPKMAEGHSFFHARSLSVSENNQILAYGVDTVGRRKYTLCFKDLATGALLADKLENTTGSAVWANDNRTVFYVVKDATLRAYKVMRHLLGQDVSEDETVYEEKDVTFSVGIYKSKTRKNIVIDASQTLATEMWLIDADLPNQPARVFEKRKEEHEYYVSHHDGRFFILTNWKAKNFRLMETLERKTSRRHWKEVVAHREDVLLEDVEVFRDFLVLEERHQGIRQLRVIKLGDESEHQVAFEEESHVCYPKENKDFDTQKLRFWYTSLTTPGSMFDYDMITRERELLKMEDIGGGFDPEDYKSERLWAEVRDGTRVPISLVYRKGLEKNGLNPLLLYAYGSYGSSTDPYFRFSRLSLLDRGFVFAIAHVRGGSELGRQWYEDGKLLKKKNTFFDFLDCAEFLISRKLTRPDRLFAEGGSAGGLLMGAVTNMRPDLFRGVLASVPWVDVVTTMLDESIPLTTSEFDEWGNPKDKAYYEYMLSYSPYDNVKAKDYPAIYATTGLHDSQVQYFEPAKWVARLRDKKTDENLIVLDVDMDSGHGGASGRFKRYERTARQYAFLLSLLD